MLRRAVLVSVLTIITAAGSSLLVKNLLLSQRRGRTAFTATETKRMYGSSLLVKNLLLSQRRGRTAFTATETKRMYDETQLRCCEKRRVTARISDLAARSATISPPGRGGG